MRQSIGFVPAAGRGTRFTGDCVKEMYPVPGADGVLRPIAHYALRQVVRAGVDRCVVVISQDKLDLLRAISTDAPDLDVAYVVQKEPRGLPHAVQVAHRWLADLDVVLVLPDTIVAPDDAAARVLDAQRALEADLALGVFPVSEPERMGPGAACTRAASR